MVSPALLIHFSANIEKSAGYPVSVFLKSISSFFEGREAAATAICFHELGNFDVVVMHHLMEL